MANNTKKSLGKDVQDAQHQAKALAAALTGLDIAKLNNNQQLALLKALAMRLGMCDSSGIIK